MALKAAAAAGLALAATALAAPAWAGDCEDLAKLRPGGMVVTHAEAVTPAPVWRAPQTAYAGEMRTPFCRVEGVIEGNIGVEVWLPPKASWTGRLLGAGVGGNAGMFNYSDMSRGVARGFATTSTDSGHKASDTRWMMDPKKREDYAHRAEHLMTVAAKAVIAAYYGRPQSYAYFVGCSGGGRQALKEAQLYPQDYNGIIAGASGPDMPMLSARHLWTALYQQRNPAGALTDADWNLISAAVTAQCDPVDGLKDGLIEDPRACRFDPASIDCAKAAGPCLSAEKVTTLRTIYAPLRDETGRQVDDGIFPGVRTRPGPPPPLLLELFAQGVHGDPNWDPNTFSILRDVEAVYRGIPELRANNPDLSGLKRAGGKLILYTGWADPSVIAQQTLGYHAAVERRMGDTSAFTRMYLAPGVFHCRGGPGPDLFGGSGNPAPEPTTPANDMLLALIDWVERGKSPQAIVATKVADGKVVRTRPLCPFPQVARYRGQGDPDKAESFVCQKP